jgi:hypothetical protein
VTTMSILKNFDARTESQYHSPGFFPHTGRRPVWRWILSSKPQDIGSLPDRI